MPARSLRHARWRPAWLQPDAQTRAAVERLLGRPRGCRRASARRCRTPAAGLRCARRTEANLHARVNARGSGAARGRSRAHRASFPQPEGQAGRHPQRRCLHRRQPACAAAAPGADERAYPATAPSVESPDAAGCLCAPAHRRTVARARAKSARPTQPGGIPARRAGRTAADARGPAHAAGAHHRDGAPVQISKHSYSSSRSGGSAAGVEQRRARSAPVEDGASTQTKVTRTSARQGRDDDGRRRPCEVRARFASMTLAAQGICEAIECVRLPPPEARVSAVTSSCTPGSVAHRAGPVERSRRDGGA